MRSLFSAKDANERQLPYIITGKLTIDRKVAQSSARSPLYLRVMTTEEKQDGVQGVPANRLDFLLSYLCKGQCCTPLKVDIVRERERCKCGEGGTLEEVRSLSI